MALLQYLFAAQKASGPDKRRNPRHMVEQASNLTAGGVQTSAVLMDVSMCGARITSRYPRDKSAIVHITLVVDGASMQIPMRVRWQRMADGWHEFGGDFLRLSLHQEQHLAAFVSRHCQQEQPRETRQLISA
jgi:hypothetical protein